MDHSAFQNRPEPAGSIPNSSLFHPVPQHFPPDPTGISTEREAVFLHGNHRIPDPYNSWLILCPDPFWKTKEYNPDQGFRAPEMSGFHWNRSLARGILIWPGYVLNYIYTLMGILAGSIAEAEGKESCRFRSETYRRDCKWSCWIFFHTIPVRFR